MVHTGTHSYLHKINKQKSDFILVKMYLPGLSRMLSSSRFLLEPEFLESPPPLPLLSSLLFSVKLQEKLSEVYPGAIVLVMTQNGSSHVKLND